MPSWTPATSRSTGPEGVERSFAELSAQGFRVLALATRPLDKTRAEQADEAGMTLRGLLTFHDPPKPGAAEAIRQLGLQGVAIRLITGDNRLAAAKVAADVGLEAEHLLTGAEIDALDDEALEGRAVDSAVFAEVEPLHKERIVRALRAGGSVVSFLGDGINDAAALHAADIGISINLPPRFSHPGGRAHVAHVGSQGVPRFPGAFVASLARLKCSPSGWSAS